MDVRRRRRVVKRSEVCCGKSSAGNEKGRRARQDNLRERYSGLEANVNAHLATAIGDEMSSLLKSFIDTSA